MALHYSFAFHKVPSFPMQNMLTFSVDRRDITTCDSHGGEELKSVWIKPSVQQEVHLLCMLQLNDEKMTTTIYGTTTSNYKF